jgi:glycosyltransferase involved in cell wall biosynthesis
LLKALDPDTVLIHGLIYSWQVFLIRKTLGKKVRIMLQHHGEQVPGGWRKWLMKEADSYVDNYFFTSREQATAWIQEGVINNPQKIAEVLTGSSALTLPESNTSGLLLLGNPVLLWVGRLDHNKDPLTILEGFSLLLKNEPDARLYMIYQAEETPGALQAVLQEDESLKVAVTLVGAVNHLELANWYLAADLFVSGSRREACGYALLEAMHCRCIPVVTDIPSFRKITAEGTAGFLFEPGNPESCYKAMVLALSVDRKSMNEKVKHHFVQNLSFEAIAKQMMRSLEEGLK